MAGTHVSIATDSFTRADSGSLGANWSDGPEAILNSAHAQIVSNTATNTGIHDNDQYWSGTGSFNFNQYSQATVKSISPGTDCFTGVTVRASATDYVMAQLNKAGGGYFLYWYNGGTYTALGSYTTTPAVNDVLLLEAVGTSYFFYLNGTLRITAIDGGGPTTGVPGIILSGDSGSSTSLDDWEGGDVVAFKLDTSSRFTGITAPLTASYTCASGVTLMLLSIVGGSGTNRGGTAPTYNGVAFTQVGTTQKAASSPECSAELWYLLNPTTGSSQTISIPNTGTAINLYATASSWIPYSGYTASLDQTTTSNGTSANPSLSNTPTANGALIYGVLADGNNAAPSADTHITFNRTDDGNYSDNNQYYLQSVAAAVSLGWTIGSDDWGAVVGSFKLTSSGSLIKTINALAKASIKTVNGLAIASVKTFNGLA